MKEHTIIVGAGPCGLAAALALQKLGINPLVIEKGNVVNALHNFPTHQTYFSTSERLEIGGIPFITEERKPKKNQSLVYYREVVTRANIRVNTFEKVMSVTNHNEAFSVQTDKETYIAKHIIIATGYYDNPNFLHIPGEEMSKVFHYFKEGHPFYRTNCVVIGGKNSSIDAALELVKCGANVTVLYRGEVYSSSIKPWILPEFEALVKTGEITMEFQADVQEITETEVIYTVGGETKRIANDFVFAMIGYHPDHTFLQKIGINIDQETGRPTFNPETMETNVSNIFIAGVIAAGNHANEIFIENGKLHGALIAKVIEVRDKIE